MRVSQRSAAAAAAHPPARLPPLTGPARLQTKTLGQLAQMARAQGVHQTKIDEALESAQHGRRAESLLALLASGGGPGGGDKGTSAPHAFASAAGSGATGTAPGLPARVGALRLHMVTWNLHGGLPNEPLASLFPSGHDVYVVATQENCSSSLPTTLLWSSHSQWIEQLRGLLAGCELISQRSLGAIHLAIFVRSELAPTISCVRSSNVATGFANVLGNKGAVGICLKVRGRSLAFVSSHLAAHQEKVAERNADFHRIDQGLPLECAVPAVSPAGTPLGGRFDCVFWLGDLNYRINGNRTLIERLITSKRRSALRNNDQLLGERAKGNAFVGYEEGQLSFDPTFKFDPGTSTYDTSPKQRLPAWTDRILFCCAATEEQSSMLVLTEYASLHEITFSDHKPVFACFELVGLGSASEKNGATAADEEAQAGGTRTGQSAACVVQ
eukprot:COSAG05_NODE_461_length_9571_cov_14.935283_10_plen_442_part_00